MRSPGKGLARLAILTAAVIWGVSFVIVQQGLRDLPVFHLLAARFALGALVLVPFLVVQARREGRRYRPTRLGLAVGLALFGGFALQTYGLLWTTPSRSAFLTGLSVLIVPILAWATRGERPRTGPMAGAILAALGLAVMYRLGAGGGEAGSFGVGDALTIAGAASYACHLLLIDRAMRATRATSAIPTTPAGGDEGAIDAGPATPVSSALELAMTQFLVVFVLSAPSLALRPPAARELTLNAMVAIGITGILATAVAFLCQIYAQRRLGAMETVVILTLEPVFAAAAAIALGIELFSASLVAGGGLIIAGTLLAQIGPPPRSPG